MGLLFFDSNEMSIYYRGGQVTSTSTAKEETIERALGRTCIGSGLAQSMLLSLVSMLLPGLPSDQY